MRTVTFIFIPFSILILRIHDQAFRQKLSRHLNDTCQCSTRIITKIKNQCFHAIFSCLCDLLCKLISGHILKLCDLNIRNIAIQHLIADSRCFHLFTCHGNIQIICFTLTVDRQRYSCIFLAFDECNHICCCHAFCTCAIYLYNDILRLQPCCFSRGVRYHTCDLTIFRLSVNTDISTDTIVNALCAFPQGIELIRCIIFGIRITERIDHTLINPCLQILVCRIPQIIFMNTVFEKSDLIFYFICQNRIIRL